jgi:BlaI family penicillinase repressor
MERKLLDSEWTILRALWGKAPRTMREIIAAVQAEQPKIGWQYKTYHSYLRIMLEKGLIRCEDKNRRDKLYFPLITREEALKAESETLLSRISTGSMGALVAMMADNGQLSDKDRQALLSLAEKLEREGGEPQ